MEKKLVQRSETKVVADACNALYIYIILSIQWCDCSVSLVYKISILFMDVSKLDQTAGTAIIILDHLTVT